ncbi:hypothetical protein P8C59_007723 [Phyllachora maydis]|uniref:Clr5 domain-containing protein n=1 Tax=Phyllachora maydis TaxID=1825666 RepID=A0AAD9I9M2_9PEZI|nr:hypothetical protein P8C59_007723 [Phyllachora maydis]
MLVARFAEDAKSDRGPATKMSWLPPTTAASTASMHDAHRSNVHVHAQVHAQVPAHAGVKTVGKAAAVRPLAAALRRPPPPAKGPARGSLPPSLICCSATPIIPKQPRDWEPWKPILEELYMHQNCILREVMDVMESSYNVRATAKMYKGQFARWSWFKYAVKKRPRDQLARLPGKGKIRDVSLVVNGNHDTVDSLLANLLFENQHSRVMQAGLTTMRHFLHGFVESEPGTLKQDVVFLFDDPTYRYFKTAMDLFRIGAHPEGGRVLRLAFLQIERKLGASDIKSFTDLCLLMPHLLSESARPDILAAYLDYVARLARVKLPPHHPLNDLIAAFAELVALGMTPELTRYITLLARVHAETVAALRDMLGRTQLWARNQYLAMEAAAPDPPGASPCPSPGSSSGTAAAGAGAARGQHTMPRLEAQGVYFAQHLLVRNPESDALAEQWLARRFTGDFAARTQRVLRGLQARIRAGQFPAEYADMIECLYCGWLNDFYEDMGDWDSMFAWGERGLQKAAEEQFVIWSVHLEELMREHGRSEQAEELRRRRAEHDWLENVRVQVDELALEDAE